MHLPATIAINTDVICQEIDQQTVLLNPVTGGYFGLDPISTFIWQLLQELDAVAEVLACMVEAFGADPEQLQQDLQTFLAQLKAADLIEYEAAE